MSRHLRALALLIVPVLAACSSDASVTAPTAFAPDADAAVATATMLVEDGFEKPSFNPAWSLVQQGGTITRTSSPTNKGTGAVAMHAGSGDRTMRMIRNLAAPTKGEVSIWTYDAAPGVETLYQALTVRNTQTQANVYVGINDYDAFCYITQVVDAQNVPGGPGATCGIFPQHSTTSVQRTLGWHRFRVVVAQSTVSVYIDQVLVYTRAIDFTFDQIEFGLSGPSWRPATSAFYDDVRVAAP